MRGIAGDVSSSLTRFGSLIVPAKSRTATGNIPGITRITRTCPQHETVDVRFVSVGFAGKAVGAKDAVFVPAEPVTEVPCSRPVALEPDDGRPDVRVDSLGGVCRCPFGGP